MNDKVRRALEKIREFNQLKRRDIIETSHEGKPLTDFEYLTHHIETKNGKEEVHHCFLYDHIANLYKQGHLVIKDGKALLNGKAIKEGTFHVITGLEEGQFVVWSDKEAVEAGITPKAMRAGMTKKQKAKEW